MSFVVNNMPKGNIPNKMKKEPKKTRAISPNKAWTVFTGCKRINIHTPVPIQRIPHVPNTGHVAFLSR